MPTLNRTHTNTRKNQQKLRILNLQALTKQAEPSPSTVELQNIIQDNTARWQVYLEQLKKLKRHARLAFISDVHLPYQDNCAIELAAEILSDFKPDIRTGFNDVFDFTKLGKWEDKDMAFQRLWHSDLQYALNAHRQWMDIIRSTSSRAVDIGVMDNHGRRFFNYLLLNAPHISEWAFVKFVKELNNHKLLWIHPDESASDRLSIQLSPGLMVLHGYRTSTNASMAVKRTMEDYGYQRSMFFGHIHRAGLYQLRGPDYNVMGISTGCLCQLQPEYSDRFMNWQQGIGLGYFDPNGRYSNLQHIQFESVGDRLVAFWGDKEYSVTKHRLALTC